jgi:hypothetical protein
MIKFAEPDVDSLYDALVEAISISRRIVPSEMHERVKSMYHWADVARRTEIVYNNISSTRRASLAERLVRYSTVGPFSGFAMCLIVASLHLLWRLCELLWPANSIERAAALELLGDMRSASPASSPQPSPISSPIGGAHRSGFVDATVNQGQMGSIASAGAAQIRPHRQRREAAVEDESGSDEEMITES